MKIVALSTCHNRKKLTLNTLDSLHNQKLPAFVNLDIVIVDDGSTDGTSDAINSKYHDVHLIRGTGDLYWNGGMQLGWEAHVKNCEFDYLLVFNDDIQLKENALAVLLDTANQCIQKENCDAFAVVGAFKNPGILQDKTTYGGVVRDSLWYPLRFKQLDPLQNSYRECETLNMNFAIISKKAIELVGFLSPDFTHAKADYDFGLRLKKADGKILLAPGYIGACKRNSNKGTFKEANISIRERWRRLTGKKKHIPKERAIYLKRHIGFLWWFYWILTYLNVFFIHYYLMIRSAIYRNQ